MYYQVYLMFPIEGSVPTMYHRAIVKTWYEALVAMNKELDAFFPQVDRSVAIVDEFGKVLYQISKPKDDRFEGAK